MVVVNCISQLHSSSRRAYIGRISFAFIEATQELHLQLADSSFDNLPVDLPMSVLFGKAPRMHREIQRRELTQQTLQRGDMELAEAVRLRRAR